MIAVLEFNLDMIDDQKHHIRMLKANQMAIALWQIQHNLYNDITKGEELSLEQEILFSKIIESINQTLDKYHIYTEELTN